MANLPEKNITTVDKITSIPSNTNLYINANGEFRQATVDDVLKASPVIADSIANQYKNASGSPILLTDSAKGVAIDFNAKGRSTQTQYSGKNLLDCSGLSATTTNGVTFTPVYDDNGSLLYVNVNGTATANTLFKLNDMNVTENEQYTLNGCPSGGSSTTYRLYDNDNIGLTDYGSGVTKTSTKTGTIGIYIRIDSGYTANNLKFYPMIRLASVTDSTYEPYVGGTASPNPDYPQAIKSNGDMGYFDGELLSGIYNTTNGVYTANNYYVCGKNPIPCVGGDTIKLIYGGTARVIDFIFFDENGAYLSKSSATNTTETSVTVPTNASYFKFNVSESTTVAITPQTAKHICVTINDKYALIVDSVGKNELKIESSTYINGGITFTIDKGVLTVNGTPTVVAQMTTPITLKKGKYILSGAPSNSSAQTYRHYVYDSSNAKSYIDYGSNVEFEVYENSNLLYCIQVAVEVSNVTFYPMIRPLGTDATYEPYIHSRKYIPISAPLRGIGEVRDELRLEDGKIERKFAEVVFDGSSDEGWSLKAIGCELYLNNTNSGNALCTHYKKNNGVSWGDLQDNEFNIVGTVLRIKDDTHQGTLDEWKAWLQANPITVIYELAEPTIESIEPIEIVTYDNVTHISVSDNADMEIEYPTSKVAGIASIGWSKGRRAEYDLEQLKAQMLALQTTIVSTV